ncbi:pantoate--beta-alanine ligase [Cyclobacterium lianum]|uniref:pantoate--beta-alanine ligase n=1 Tax=Cyclobacterium lianum TaxID=388280 RepID=UPI000934F8E6|nr:pantoate--beta-alanine ligase [Cyclobacterium lianum]
MEKVETIPAVRQQIKRLKSQGKSIGLVPTMGALHRGHVELIRAAKKVSDITVVSIFVNPIQFNNPEDLFKYPRTLARDLELLAEEGVDLVFVPDEKEIYPESVITEFDFGPMEQIMEGKFRPGHFNGVAIVVAKLFHILLPDRAFFGQKDLQQVAIIRRLTADLSMDTRIRMIPTVRDEDGLALSSRNLRLSEKGRTTAPRLYQALRRCETELLNGGDWFTVRNKVIQEELSPAGIQTEYLELVELKRFSLLHKQSNGVPFAICIAANIENIRLIDNLVIGE